jgi:hypothetical protein
VYNKTMPAKTQQLPAAQHARAVRESAAITKTLWRLMKKEESAKIDLQRILRTLTEKRIPFVLTGAHGIGTWTGQPRATHDVDILVRIGRNHARAVKAMRELYPHLEVKILPGVTALLVPGETRSAIDISYPYRADILETLASTVWAEDQGLRYRIPGLEAAVANKYGAMLTLGRDPGKRLQDAADFTNMVRHSTEKEQPALDLHKLRDLGEKVWPGGGGNEILQLVEQAQQGKVVNVNGLMGTPGQ